MHRLGGLNTSKDFEGYLEKRESILTHFKNKKEKAENNLTSTNRGNRASDREVKMSSVKRLTSSVKKRKKKREKREWYFNRERRLNQFDDRSSKISHFY